MKNKISNKFKVPTDYFATMENEILSKVNKETMPKVVPFYQQVWVKTTMGIAASLLLIFGIYTFTQQEEVTQEDRTAATEFIYESYFEENNNLDEFTLEEQPLYADIVLLAED